MISAPLSSHAVLTVPSVALRRLGVGLLLRWLLSSVITAGGPVPSVLLRRGLRRRAVTLRLVAAGLLRCSVRVGWLSRLGAVRVGGLVGRFGRRVVRGFGAAAVARLLLVAAAPASVAVPVAPVVVKTAAVAPLAVGVAAVDQVLQSGVHLLVGTLQYFNQRLGLLAVAGREESVCRSFLTRPPGSANPVHVVLNLVGEIVVDDKLNTFHVDAAGGHVSRHHDGGFTRPELVQRQVSFRLGLVAVDAHGRPAVPPHVPGDLVAFPLGLGENDGLVLALLHDFLHQAHQLAVLLVLVANVDDLQDVLVGRQLHRSHLQVNGVGEKIFCHLLHFLRPSGGPHQSLPVRADLTDDFSDLGLETHVQHPVGFVENQVGAPPQVSLASVQEINKPSRGSDHNLAATFKVLDLGSFRRSSVDASVPDVAQQSVCVCHLLNLLGKLPCWQENQRDRSVTPFKVGLGVYVDEGGQEEGKSLSGTGLGNANGVPSTQRVRPPHRLNCSWGFEAHAQQFVSHVLGEVGLSEGENRLLNISSGHSYLFRPVELFYLVIRPHRNCWVFLVKVLLKGGKF